MSLVRYFTRQGFRFAIRTRSVPAVFIYMTHVRPRIRGTSCVRFISVVIPPSSLLLLYRPRLLTFCVDLRLCGGQDMMGCAIKRMLLSLFLSFSGRGLSVQSFAGRVRCDFPTVDVITLRFRIIRCSVFSVLIGRTIRRTSYGLLIQRDTRGPFGHMVQFQVGGRI